jgi:hypothetical protein
MNKNNFILIASIILVLFLQHPALSQQHDSLHGKICLTHKMTQINQHRFVNNNAHIYRNNQLEDDFLIVPCVVHIIHDGGVENISDDMVISQIEVLNEDFGHFGPYNQDDRGEDAKIRFCLATRDPDGAASSGIVRVQSSQTNMDSENEMAMKDLSYWDPQHYLNVWIVKTIDNNSQFIGYSYQPSLSGGPLFNGDGVVIKYNYFGRTGIGFNNLGRTCTHEFGHYFDLMHPWGGDSPGEGDCQDDDGIFDTPNCSLDYYSHPINACPHPTQCGNIRLIEDFMDYSYDECMKLFTPGQIKHMRGAISLYRSELVSYQNLVNTGCVNLYDSLNSNSRVDIRTNPTQHHIIFVTHYSKGLSDLVFSIYDIRGHLMREGVFYDIGKTDVSYDLLGLRPGIYLLKGHFAGESFHHKVLIY